MMDPNCFNSLSFAAFAASVAAAAGVETGVILLSIGGNAACGTLEAETSDETPAKSDAVSWPGPPSELVKPSKCGPKKFTAP